jgi:hypothetical protein
MPDRDLMLFIVASSTRLLNDIARGDGKRCAPSRSSAAFPRRATMPSSPPFEAASTQWRANDSRHGYTLTGTSPTRPRSPHAGRADLALPSPKAEHESPVRSRLSVPGKSRTCDQRFRKALLYPAELRGLVPACRAPRHSTGAGALAREGGARSKGAPLGRAAPRIEADEALEAPDAAWPRGLRGVRRAGVI